MGSVVVSELNLDELGKLLEEATKFRVLKTFVIFQLIFRASYRATQTLT